MVKSAFDVEKARQKLAEKGELGKLKNLYKTGLPEIKDLNKPEFWDERYLSDLGLSHQDGMTRDRIKTVSEFIPKGKIKILDIGAGLGWIEEIISKDNDKVIYGNDFSKKSVKILKKRFSGNYSVQSIYKLNYPKNFFDVILLLEVLEHIPPSKIFSVLKSINKLLKKNGILIISVPMNEGLESLPDNPNGHVRMYTPNLIKIELKIAGFRYVESRTFFAFSSMYFIKSKIAKLIKRNNPNNIVIKSIKL